jgi:hypothetical protein
MDSSPRRPAGPRRAARRASYGERARLHAPTPGSRANDEDGHPRGRKRLSHAVEALGLPCWNVPIAESTRVEIGDVMERDDFVFADLLPILRA